MKPFITTRATDLQGNPKDGDAARRIKTRVGYAVFSPRAGGLVTTVEGLNELVGSSLLLENYYENSHSIRTTALKEVNVQPDGSIHLVTRNTIYILERVAN